MSAERLAAIESKLDAHSRTSDGHTKTLDAHTKTLDAHTKTLDAHTKTLDAHTKTLDAHTKTLDAHTRTLDAHSKTLVKLEIGQEEMRDQIAQVAEGHAATQALIKRSFVAMHALIDSKVDPFVRTVQHHSAILAAHKMSLPWEDSGV